MNLSTSLYGLLAWRVFLDVISRGTFFLVNILIARTLDVKEFGKFAYAVSLAQIFYLFTDLGSHMLLIKEMGEARATNPNKWIDFFQLKLVLFFFSFLIYMIVIPFAWHWPHHWIPVLAFFWMCSNSMLDFNQYVCNGLGRLDIAKQMMLVQRGLMLFGVLAAYFISTSVGFMMGGLAAGGILGALAAHFLFQKKLRLSGVWTWNPSEWKRIVGQSIPLGLGGGLGTLYLRAGFVILGWVWTAQIVGEYSAAFRVFEITYIIPAAVMSIGVPHLAEARKSGKDFFMKELWRILLLMAPSALGWALFLFFGSRFIITTLYGTRYLAAIPALKILALTGGMVFLNYVVTHVMIVINRQKRHLIHQIIVFSICIVLSVIFIPAQRSVGAAIGLLGAESVLFLLTLGYLISRDPSQIEKIKFPPIFGSR